MFALYGIAAVLPTVLVPLWKIVGLMMSPPAEVLTWTAVIPKASMSMEFSLGFALFREYFAMTILTSWVAAVLFV